MASVTTLGQAARPSTMRYLPWAGALVAVALAAGTAIPSVAPLVRLNPSAMMGSVPPLAVPGQGGGSSNTPGGGAIAAPPGGGGPDASMPASGGSGDTGGGAPAAGGGVSGGGGAVPSGDSGDEGDANDPFTKVGFQELIGASAIGLYTFVPREVHEGIGYSSVEMIKSYGADEGTCEAFGGGYWLGVEVEEGILGQGANPDATDKTGYHNPTIARAEYPVDSRVRQPQVNPGHWQASCEKGGDGGSGTGTYATLPVGDLSLGTATSQSDQKFDRKAGATVSQASTYLQHVVLGDLAVGFMSASLQVKQKPGGQPVVTYRISLSDLSNGDSQLLGWGSDGIVLSGTSVPASDLHKQFNQQMDAHQYDLKQIGRFGLRLVEPRTEKIDNQLEVSGAAIAVDNSLVLRDGTIGQAQGVRLLETRYAVATS